MRDRRAAATLVMLALGLLASGCATRTVTPGEPEQPPTAASAPQLPPRPEEIRIDGVDPCTLLDSQQRQQLGIDSEPRAGGGSSRGEKACSYDHTSSEPYFGFNIALVPFEGAEAWLTGRRNADVRVADNVVGFGAIEVQSIGGIGTSCSVVVDVAEGQNLDVMFDGDSSHSFSVEQLCDRARKGAQAAMETLLAR